MTDMGDMMEESQEMSSLLESAKPNNGDNSDSFSSLENQEKSVSAASGSTAPDEDIPVTFPQRLMELLDTESSESDIISWLPDGEGFIIRRKKVFAEELLPKYFKSSKFTSFTRKLNRWGFTRKSRGPDSGAYSNEFFIRGKPQLCLRMSCQSMPSRGRQTQQQPPQAPIAMLGTPNLFVPPALFGPQATLNLPSLNDGCTNTNNTDVNITEVSSNISNGSTNFGIALNQDLPALPADLSQLSQDEIRAHLHRLQVQQLQLQQLQLQQQQQMQAEELMRTQVAKQNDQMDTDDNKSLFDTSFMQNAKASLSPFPAPMLSRGNESSGSRSPGPWAA